MPSRYDRATEVTLGSLRLAAVPAAATLLSFSKITRALETDSVGGVVFPFPSGLPTLWTYVSLPNGPTGGAGGAPLSGPLSGPLFVVAFLSGLLLTSALEAGFLGSLSRRIDGSRPAFVESARRFTLRIAGANLLRAALVFAALPLLVVPPVALVVVLVVTYLTYGLSFVVVVRDERLSEAIATTVGLALGGGSYAAYGLTHLLVGAVCSFALTGFVLNGGPLAVLVAAVVVAVPCVFVAAYGLLVVRGLVGRPPTVSGMRSSAADGTE